MADSNTTTYSFTLPEVGASADSWGTKLNANWDKVDDLLDGSIAVNGITVTGGSIDGTPVGATTPSTGAFTSVDVTGTVTADSLTVDGLTKITGTRGTFVDPSEDPSFPNIFATNDAVGDFSQEVGHLVIQPRVHPTVYRDVIFAGGAGTTKRLMTLFGEGGMHLYEDTGTTAKFIWDSSAESLGIGTSPSAPLHVKGGSISTPATASAFISNATSRLVVNHANEYGVYVGYANSSNDAIGVQSARSNGVTSPLLLNPYGGNVGIGTASPATRLMLEHSNDGAVGGTIRIKDRDSQQVPGQLTGAIEFESEDATMPTSGVSTAIKAYCASTAGGSYLTLSTTDQYTSTLDERVRISDSGNVGIGHLAPASKLTVLESSGGNVGFFTNGADADLGINCTSGVTRLSPTTGTLAFGTSSTERARIDSSGNFRVGNTSTEISSVGGRMLADGRVIGVTNNSACFTARRLSSDGDLISFVDTIGSSLGSIGTYTQAGITTIGVDSADGIFNIGGNAATGFQFIDSVGSAQPRLRPSIDNSANLGESARRFKDLYLSGGVKATGMTRLGYTAGNLNGFGAENVSGVFYSGNTSSGYTAMNSDSANGCLYLSRTSSAPTGLALSFASNGAQVGSVTITGSSTSYNTSSDYRLKENVTSMDNASDRVLALNPCRFNFIADPDTTVDGFLAHEAQEVVPEAVHGTKDGMKTEEYEVSPAVEATYDEDGNELTPAVEAVMGTREVPDYQGIDQSKLVPLLTKALQEALTEIDNLKQRVDALENK